MYELLVAFLIVVLIVLFCHRRRHQDIVVVYLESLAANATTAEGAAKLNAAKNAAADSKGAAPDAVLQKMKVAVDSVQLTKNEPVRENPHSYDKCVHGCGKCLAYNTEPILREMTFFNNIYDSEHSYERDPNVTPEYQRYYAD